MPFKDPEDQKAAARRHYERNKEPMKSRAQAFSREARKRNRAFIASYLREHPCVDCGNSDIRVLEFDHVRDKKIANVAALSNRSICSLKTLQAEITKCDVRCANCHRIVTYERRLVKEKDPII